MNEVNDLSVLETITSLEDYIVICICRNENKYIEEFCEHYYGLGFSKIVLCNNVQTDKDENLLDIPYIQNTINDGRLIVLTIAQDGYQNQFYGDMVSILNFKWILIVDCDEFLVLEQHKTIQEFVEDREDCDVIVFNWKMYGYNGLFFYDERKVQERFSEPCPLSMPVNRHIKSLIRREGLLGKEVSFRNPHIITSKQKLIYKNALGEDITYFDEHVGAIQNKIIHECAWINHYYSKSIEEYIEKIKKGKADHPKGDDMRSIEDFWVGNAKTIQAQQHLNFAIQNHICGYGLQEEKVS